MGRARHNVFGGDELWASPTYNVGPNGKKWGIVVRRGRRDVPRGVRAYAGRPWAYRRACQMAARAWRRAGCYARHRALSVPLVNGRLELDRGEAEPALPHADRCAPDSSLAFLGGDGRRARSPRSRPAPWLSSGLRRA